MTKNSSPGESEFERRVRAIRDRYDAALHPHPSEREAADRRFLEEYRHILDSAVPPDQRATLDEHLKQLDACDGAGMEHGVENAYRTAKVDIPALRRKLFALRGTRRASVLATPAFRPLVPFAPHMDAPTAMPGVVNADVAGPYDNVSYLTQGTFDQEFGVNYEFPMTDANGRLAGSELHAKALNDESIEFARIDYRRDSGLLLNHTLTRRCRLQIDVNYVLRAGSHSVVFFNRGGASYFDCWQWHVPFVSMQIPLPSHDVLSVAFPGLHGIELFHSSVSVGGILDRSPTPEQWNWNFGEIKSFIATDSLIREPSAFPEGVCIGVGVRHQVALLAQYTRFEIGSMGNGAWIRWS